METLQQPKEVKARKKHACNFCGQRIPKGDTYIKSTHTYDGEIYDWKAHKYCSSISSRLNMHDNCDDGITQEDFMEIIHDEYYQIITGNFSLEDREKYGKEIAQFHNVMFRDKLGFVIRHYKKLDQTTK